MRDRLRKREQPSWVQPMLASLTDKPFSDDAWVYERKLDGVRALAFRHGDQIRLMSRNRKLMNATYPELVEAIAKQEAGDFIADGEIVAFDGGVTSFAKLQQRLGITDARRARAVGVAVHLYLFDLLYLDGHDVTQLPLRQRKELLRRALMFDDPLRFSEHRTADGKVYLEEACRQGWEGLIAKMADSPYEHRRSRRWLKFKCVNEEELVIGGYTDPQGSRTGFGALLVGYYEADARRGDGLSYAGKVGTGYDERTLRELGKRLASLRRTTSPFGGKVAEKKPHWVKPQLVAQIAFSEWTTDGKLRHPRFLGLRHDKKAREVVRESEKSEK
ncbi:MAG: non-homologous end-joining DNA ligase [Phycisphaeraceae bacterium]